MNCLIYYLKQPPIHSTLRFRLFRQLRLTLDISDWNRFLVSQPYSGLRGSPISPHLTGIKSIRAFKIRFHYSSFLINSLIWCRVVLKWRHAILDNFRSPPSRIRLYWAALLQLIHFFHRPGLSLGQPNQPHLVQMRGDEPLSDLELVLFSQDIRTANLVTPRVS